MSIFQFGAFGMLIAAVLYFVPTVVAFARGHHNRVAILLLNVFLGWTVIGWVGALVWAAMNTAPGSGASDSRPPYDPGSS